MVQMHKLLHVRVPVKIDTEWIERYGIVYVDNHDISMVDLYYSTKYVLLVDLYNYCVTVHTQFAKLLIRRKWLSIDFDFKLWDKEFLSLSIKERCYWFSKIYELEMTDI